MHQLRGGKQFGETHNRDAFMTDTAISVEDIESAERLLGLAYTARERQQMVGNLDGQIETAKARRSLSMDNSVPMATTFDPRLPDFAMPQVTDNLTYSTLAAPLPDRSAYRRYYPGSVVQTRRRLRHRRCP